MQTFATPAPITAILAVPAGRIQVTAAAQADATVEIRPADPAKGRDVKLAARVTAAYSDGVLRVTAPAANRVLGSSGAVEVTVQLPAGSAVQAKAASAQFTTEGPLGEVTFDSAQGTVRVEQAATARLTVVDGDITVGRLGGGAEIRTVKGDIQITEATHGMVLLRTETGTITVGAAAGVSATLDAGTTLGRIRNALKHTGGTPGLNIHATTTVGDITARSL
jgi:Putative adhesin